jgi:hypothetical protein
MQKGDNDKRLPGERVTCERCGQQPESIECREDCPFKKQIRPSADAKRA